MHPGRTRLPYRRQPPSGFDSRWGWSGAISFAFSFFIFFMLNVASLVPTISIALILAVAFLMIIVFPSSTAMILYRESLILMPAMLCIISALWSQYPAQTLYYGTQFAIVAIIGVHMAYWNRPGTIIGMMGASLAYLLISIVAQNKVAWLNQGASIEVGINGGKSYIGAIASSGALSSLFAMRYGLSTRRMIPLYAGAACFFIGLIAIVAARASGAFVGVFVNTLTFFGLIWLSKINAESRAKIIVVILPICVLGAIFGSDIWSAVLAFFNKSSDLTGRVFLWQRASVAIDARPWLGTGFNGFWVVGNPDAEILWNYAAIKSKSGFNFHNTFLEFAVAFGIPLAIGLCIIYLVAVIRKISVALRTGDPASVFGATVLIDWILHAAFESGGIGTFNSTILLMYFALSGTRIPRLESSASAAPDLSQGSRPSALRRGSISGGTPLRA